VSQNLAFSPSDELEATSFYLIAGDARLRGGVAEKKESKASIKWASHPTDVPPGKYRLPVPISKMLCPLTRTDISQVAE